jgi:O-antigen/teichoic acid export membrane protein
MKKRGLLIIEEFKNFNKNSGAYVHSMVSFEELSKEFDLHWYDYNHAQTEEQEDKDSLREKFLNLLNATSTVNFIAYLFLGTFAHYIVYILYGTEYTNISPIVQLLCIYMFFRSLSNATSSLIIATGKTYLDFRWNFVPIIFIPIFVSIGAKFGLIGIAASLSAFTVLAYYPYWSLITNNTIIEIPFKTYFYNTIPNFRRYLSVIKNEIRKKTNSTR